MKHGMRPQNDFCFWFFWEHNFSLQIGYAFQCWGTTTSSTRPEFLVGVEGVHLFHTGPFCRVGAGGAPIQYTDRLRSFVLLEHDLGPQTDLYFTMTKVHDVGAQTLCCFWKFVRNDLHPCDSLCFRVLIHHEYSTITHVVYRSW